MTLEELDRLEGELSAIDQQISELIEKRWKLVNPTPDEVDQAHDLLTDDWYNQIGIVDVDTGVGQWLIPDEVIFLRRLEIEDADNPTT